MIEKPVTYINIMAAEVICYKLGGLSYPENKNPVECCCHHFLQMYLFTVKPVISALQYPELPMSGLVTCIGAGNRKAQITRGREI